MSADADVADRHELFSRKAGKESSPESSVYRYGLRGHMQGITRIEIQEGKPIPVFHVWMTIDCHDISDQTSRPRVELFRFRGTAR